MLLYVNGIIYSTVINFNIYSKLGMGLTYVF